MESGSRLGEIDTARGIAILMMIVYHTIFDLSFFSISTVDATGGFWRIFAYATASLFLLIVGISLVVSHDRAAASLNGFDLGKKFLVRGTFIFALGLLVTFATWLYLREGFVIFGILHLIGISVILSVFFFRFRIWNIPIGIACILVGVFVVSAAGPVYLQAPGIEPASPVLTLLLLPLGIHSSSFVSVDYTPLFPWFGMVLIGLGLGTFMYAGGVRQFAIRSLPVFFEVPLSFLGRHSLLIYLVHQPVIILLLALITGAKVL